MPKWTKEQQQAIDARNHTILVSAAAGSGKTAVLIERIVSLVREGYRLNRMLIVTFTKAAAGEMRQRLNERLTREAAHDPEVMGQALDDLEGTDISTIHAFCQRVIRTDFQAVGIDPLARVCDDQQRQTLFDEAYKEALNALLDEPSPDSDLLALVQAFSQRELAEMTADLYGFLMSMPMPFRWLADRIGEQGDLSSFKSQRWYQVLVNKTRLEVTGMEEYLRVQAGMFRDVDAVPGLQITYDKDRQVIERLAADCGESDDAMLEALAQVSFAAAARTTKLTEGQTAWKERYYDVRNSMKKAITETKASMQLDEEQSAQDMAKILSFLRGLALLVQRVHGCFVVAKNIQNVIDFSDMEQMTLEILQQDSYREELQKEYDHIFVDECQDVSGVQDAIVQQIHGPDSCLFMVGDVKQSIYRFRLADPTLFLGRMRTFSDAEDAAERRIFLQKNFRSRANVLDASNRVFRSAMQRNVTELDYLKEDELIPGRETQNDPAVEVRLVRQKEGGRGEECLAAETAAVVKRIRELLETRFMDGEQERTYQYRDMVILLAKASGVGARLAELLEQAGVPVYFDGKDDYYGLPEIRNVKALMAVLDNPMQDVPLLTVLKMIPFDLTDSELAEIRICRTGRDVPFYEAFEAACDTEGGIGDKCRSIRARMAEWRFLRETMRLSDFVWHVIQSSGYYAACGAYPEGELRQANLRLFCQKAAEYEANFDGSLSGFLNMIDMQIRTEDSRSAKMLGESENLVRIMTMHKSKGLEFPVVFCMRLTSGMFGPSAGTIRMHNKLGLCLPYVNRELNIRRDHPAAAAFKHQQRLDEMAERCRQLYVAMTRAREVLILTGCSEDEGRLCWTLPRGDYRVWKANTMMDWVMQTVMEDLQLQELPEHSAAAGPWLLAREDDLPAIEGAARVENTGTQDWVREVVGVPADMHSAAWWKEIGQIRAVRPLKTSVTSLAKQQVFNDPMPLSDADETMDDKRAGEEITAPLRMSELPSRPAFMEQKAVTGADRGTVMHHVLSLIDLDAVRGRQGAVLNEALRASMDQLTDMGCLTSEERGMVRMDQITAWFTGPLGQRMLASGLVRREWGFNLRVGRKNDTLLQGIIDCAFMEDGKWILVDYKTDRIESDEAFVQRHAMQLSWYARALEKITGHEVAEMWLYALGKNRAYPVERAALPDEE